MRVIIFCVPIFFVGCFGSESVHIQDYGQPKLIAHAGGFVNGRFYTNSLQALNENYQKGYRFFELDFGWTKDDRLVLIHDWESTYKKFFNKEDDPPTLEEFLALKMNFGLTQLSFEKLLQWMDEHADVTVIIDSKERTREVIRYIKEHDAKSLARFIPQIYFFEQYDSVRNFGFERIILTLYRINTAEKKVRKEIVKFAKSRDLYAVSISDKVAFATDLSIQLNKAGIFVYAHSINEQPIRRALEVRGVRGIYSDFMKVD